MDGEKLRELRIKAGYSQQTLADALFVSRELVSKWETGARSPDRAAFDRLEALLGPEVDALRDLDAVFRELTGCVPAGETSPESLARKLDTFLATLGVRDRSVFVRRYYFAEEAPVIGEHYGLGDNHVRAILTRTRRKLKKYLEEGSR